ncbi:MAG: class I SAM-dependent methyltransferase [Acidobacteriota bacterium]
MARRHRRGARARAASHQDPPKNWDSLAALRVILGRTQPAARVLDAGAATYSVILPWLAAYGYQDLTGNNLLFGKPIKVGPITYEQGDITKLRFADGSLDVVTCLSVIEHNVDVSGFLREAARVLAPGGLLVVSMDYFDPPIDTKGAIAYGGPVKVFSAADARAMLDEARALGLQPTSEPDLTCKDKCVTWSRFGLEFTFLLLTLQKLPKQ